MKPLISSTNSCSYSFVLDFNGLPNVNLEKRYSNDIILFDTHGMASYSSTVVFEQAAQFGGIFYSSFIYSILE